MNLSRLLGVVVVLAPLLCASCQSSKVAYGNSYYFKATPRPAVPTPDLYASAAPTLVSPQPLSVPDLPIAALVSPQRPLTEVAMPSRKEVRQKRRAHRRAVRTQLKQWIKEAPENVKESVKQQVEGFTRVGIIVGAAGLVMLLVGLLAGGNGFLVALGGILLGIGVVFILIDIL